MSPAEPRAEVYQAGLLVCVAPTGSLWSPFPPHLFSLCWEQIGQVKRRCGFRIWAEMTRHHRSWRCCDGRERCEMAMYGLIASRCSPPHPPPPLGMDRGLMLPSETKLKDLSPAPHLFCAPLPRRWVPFTTIRWKCDTVRQNFHLGLHRGVEVCVTYF